MKNPVLLILAALVALTVSCTEFETVELGVCGNRVLEVGEDCDGSSAFDGGTCGGLDTANACFYTCEDTTCPAGWSCGTDMRCRQSAAGFELSGGPWTFDVDSFAIGDVDGDGLEDFIGSDREFISVRYGSASTSFDDFLRVRASQDNPVTYADFDGDARLDVLIPNESGLSVLRGTEGRDLVSVAFSPFDLSDAAIDLQTVRALPADDNDVVEQTLFVDRNNRSIYSQRTRETLSIAANFPCENLATLGCEKGELERADIIVPLPSGDIIRSDGDSLDEVVALFRGHDVAYVYEPVLKFDASTCGALGP